MHEHPIRQVPDDEHANLASETFRMLSDPTRVKLLWALFQGEHSVGALADMVGAAPTAVSQHLAKLRLAGLVQSRREGTFAYYRSADEHVQRLLTEALSHAEHVSGMVEHTYR
ncbi:ArsR/SmtB family transcription factor [Tessaracoccus lubricantis]